MSEIATTRGGESIGDRSFRNTARSVSSGLRRLVFGILLTLIGLTAAFYRDFSYIGIRLGGTPLYVTELSLLLILAVLVLESFQMGQVRVRLLPSGIFAGLYLAWGAFCLARGVEDGLVSVRESAANYYAIFYFLVAGLVAHQRDLDRLWRILLIGTCAAAVVILARVATGFQVITSTGAIRFHAPVAVGASATLFWLLGVPAKQAWKRTLCITGACACLFTIVVATQHRSAALALAASLFLWLALFERGRSVHSIGSRKATIAIVVTGMILLLLMPEVGRLTAGRLRTIGSNLEEFNATWRLLYWGLLLTNIWQSPVLGFGFGDNLPVFQFRGVWFGLDPAAPAGVHNSFLFVWYKEGLVGLILLVGFSISVLWTVSRQLRGRSVRSELWQASAASSAFAFVAVFAFFNVVLEGPYMGIFFWIFAAMAELAVVLSGRAGDGRLAPNPAKATAIE